MGGILSKPKVPTAPTPQEQAEAQQITQFTPQGNLIFGTQGPGGEFIPRESGSALRVEESDFQTQLRLLGEQLSTSLGGQLTSQFGQSGLTELQTDFGAQQQAAGDSIFQAGVQRLQPQFDLQRDRLDQQLADQGVPRGSQAFDDEIRKLDERQNEQLSRLSLQAKSASGQEQNRLASLAATQRAQQFSELGALLGFTPSFQPQNAQGVDLNANFASQLGASRANAAAQQQQVDNISSLATTGAFLFSDRSLKENIKPIGEENGFNVYEFNYITDPDVTYVGVMADEVELVKPEAVAEIDGFKAVNYELIGVTFREVA